MAPDTRYSSDTTSIDADNRQRGIYDLVTSLSMLEKLDLIERLTRSIRVQEEANRQPEIDEERRQAQRKNMLDLIDELEAESADVETVMMTDRDHDRIIYGV